MFAEEDPCEGAVGSGWITGVEAKTLLWPGREGLWNWRWLSWPASNGVETVEGAQTGSSERGEMKRGVHRQGISHDAPGSMAGYLYQVRYALLRALEEARRNPGRMLLIEKFDDVAFAEEGQPVELIQTKHHLSKGDVSDRSVDVWRTLSVWIDRLGQDPTGAANTRLVLVTTNTAPDGSALSMLRKSSVPRDEEAALDLLLRAAERSQNAVTEGAREAFLSMSDTERKILVGNMWVFDEMPDIVDVREEIEEILHYSAQADQLQTFADELEGWWFSRVVGALGGTDASEIAVVSVERKVSELRERFKVGNLMVDEALEAMTPDTAAGSGERTFVRQLWLVDVSDREVEATVYDYYRAIAQRSRWARENLLLDGEAERYDRKLFDAWQRRFLGHMADVDGETEEVEKRALGRGVFRWSREYQKPFRNRDELWLSSGSFQMLADVVRVGWHPEFEQRLSGPEKKT